MRATMVSTGMVVEDSSKAFFENSKYSLFTLLKKPSNTKIIQSKVISKYINLNKNNHRYLQIYTKDILNNNIILCDILIYYNYKFIINIINNDTKNFVLIMNNITSIYNHIFIDMYSKNNFKSESEINYNLDLLEDLLVRTNLYIQEIYIEK